MGMVADMRRAMASHSGEDLPISFPPLENDPVFQVLADHHEFVAQKEATAAVLENIEEDIKTMGGVDRSIALECFRVIEGFGKGRLKLEHYTSSVSRTNLKLTMEEVDARKAGIIAAVIAAVVAMVYAVGKWIYKKLSGDDSGGDGGSPGGGNDNWANPDNIAEKAKEAEAAVECVEDKFKDLDEDARIYAENLKKLVETAKVNIAAFESEGLKRLKEHDDGAINETDPDKKAELMKKRKEIMSDLRQKFVKLTESNGEIFKALNASNDFLTFNKALPEHLRNKALTKLISNQDYRYATYVAREEYVTAMTAACSTFPSIIQMTDNVVTMTEECLEWFSKAPKDDGGERDNWNLPQVAQDFIKRREDPEGPFGFVFLGKKMLISEVISKINELKHKPGNPAEATVARAMESIKVNYMNGNIKAYMAATSEIWERITKLQNRLQEIQRVSEQIDREPVGNTSESGLRMMYRKNMMNLVKVASSYTNSALHLATTILNYSVEYTAFVNELTIILRNEMMRPDVARQLEETRKKTRHIIEVMQKEFGEEGADKYYFQDMDELMSKDLDERRHELLKQMEKAQIRTSGWKFDPKTIQKESRLQQAAQGLIGKIAGLWH